MDAQPIGHCDAVGVHASGREPREVLDEAVRRSRMSAGDRVGELKDLALPVAQSAIAAALAWVVARQVVGHPRPFFAPISALIAIGATHGQPGRRAVELVVGVSLGVGVADLLIAGIGTGTWQLALVVVLAMTAAILVGGRELVRLQAGVSAVLVATLQPPTGGVNFSRAVDALVGGVAALVVTSVIPAHPLARVRRAADAAIPELAATIDDIAAALRGRDRQGAGAALERARALDALTDRLRDQVETGRDIVRLSPRRQTRERLVTYADAAVQLDLAVRNVRVLARGALRAIELGDPVPPLVPDAVDDLALSVRSIGTALATGKGEETARTAAVRAAGKATLALEETGNLSVSVLVGQVRSTAVDLLRALGVDPEEGRAAVREAADAQR
jgi:uncharacterized membrane protein YgaE (UPF0421/DUF939 family)